MPNLSHILEQLPVVAIVISLMMWQQKNIKEMHTDWKSGLLARDTEMQATLQALTKAVESLSTNTTRNTAALIMMMGGKDGNVDINSLERIAKVLMEIK